VSTYLSPSFNFVNINPAIPFSPALLAEGAIIAPLVVTVTMVKVLQGDYPANVTLL
jgi:hypothetical protein